MADYENQTPSVANLYDAPADVYFDPSSTNVFLGATKGATTISAQSEHTGIQVEQAVGDIGFLLTNQSCEVKGVLAEQTLSNLQKLLGSGTGTGFGSNKAESTVEIALKGRGPSDTERTITFHKVQIATGTEVTNAKGEVTGYPFTFKCVKDLTKSDGDQFFSITEV
jgi:hypothetical protein